MKIIDKLLCPIDYDCKWCEHCLIRLYRIDRCLKEFSNLINVNFYSTYPNRAFVTQRHDKDLKHILCCDYKKRNENNR